MTDLLGFFHRHRLQCFNVYPIAVSHTLYRLSIGYLLLQTSSQSLRILPTVVHIQASNSIPFSLEDDEYKKLKVCFKVYMRKPVTLSPVENCV
ncbi:hypothetical protein V2J09_023662 [Rumex salicifolius]